MKLNRLYAYSVVALAIAQVLLVLASWLFSAMMAEGVRSLLSDEGLRWFFGSFTALLATPVLVWLLLISMALGCLWQSGLLSTKQNGYRTHVAWRVVALTLIIYLSVVAALTVVPHAILLSSTGQLFPSPFSRAIVPVLSFGIILLSAAYGWTSGRFDSAESVVHSFTFGLAKAAPLFVLYVMLMQFYESLRFVLL